MNLHEEHEEEINEAAKQYADKTSKTSSLELLNNHERVNFTKEDLAEAFKAGVTFGTMLSVKSLAIKFKSVSNQYYNSVIDIIKGAV